MVKGVIHLKITSHCCIIISISNIYFCSPQKNSDNPGEPQEHLE